MIHNTLLISLLLLTAIFPALGQGITSQLSDENGYFGRFGLSLQSGQLMLGKDIIQTNKLVFGMPGSPPPPSPTLGLNPHSGLVSIGNTINNSGALTIRSHQESLFTRDLQFETNGNIGSEGSLFFQLDDDDNELASFRVKGSNFNTDLFYVGENGVSFFDTDLVVFGEISAGNIKTSDVYTIGFSDVEVLGQFGDELYASMDGFVYGDNDDGFTSPQLGAAVNLPHQARITKVEFLFKDGMANNNFCAELFEMGNLSNTRTSLFRRCSSDSFISSNWQKWSNSITVDIDNVNKLYFIAFHSGNWGESIHLRQVKIYFNY